MTTWSISGTSNAGATATGRAYAYYRSGVLKLNPLAQEMVEWLPGAYQNGTHIRNVYEAIGVEFYRAQQAMLDVQAQMFLSTATWGLTYWEQMLGLPTQPESENYEERRALCAAVLASKFEESELYFKRGMELVVGGTDMSPKIVITQGNPSTSPYSLSIEAAINYFEDEPADSAWAKHGPWDSGIWYEVGPVAADSNTKLIDLVHSDNTPLGLDNGSEITIHAYYNGVLTEPTFMVTATNTLGDLLDAMEAEFSDGLDLANFILNVDGTVTYVSAPDSSLTSITYTAINAALANLPVFNAAAGASTTYGGGAGSIPVGTYTYKVSYVFPSGETLPGPVSNAVYIADTGTQVVLADVPISDNIEVSSRRIFRKETGGSVWELVGTISNNYSIFFTDTAAAGTDDALTTPTAKTALARRLEAYIAKTKPAHLTTTSSSTGFRVGISQIGVDEL